MSDRIRLRAGQRILARRIQALARACDVLEEIDRNEGTSRYVGDRERLTSIWHSLQAELNATYPQPRNDIVR